MYMHQHAADHIVQQRMARRLAEADRYRPGRRPHPRGIVTDTSRLIPTGWTR